MTLLKNKGVLKKKKKKEKKKGGNRKILLVEFSLNAVVIPQFGSDSRQLLSEPLLGSSSSRAR